MPDAAASGPASEVWVGRHLFRWEPPDIGYVAYKGDLDGEAATALSVKSRVITLGKPRVFLLVNMSQIGQISKEARSASAGGCCASGQVGLF